MSMPFPTVPISVLIACKNEAANLGRCLDAVRGWADEIVVVDSQSTDGSIDLAQSHGAKVMQFHYEGGWPKKRQWALDSQVWRNDWVLLLDADEILESGIRNEISEAISNPAINGYWLRFQIVFLGRMLRHGDTELWKLSLFRTGMGRYEMRLKDQDQAMADMEVHEQVVVEGATGRLASPIRHENVNSLDRFIEKHNAYSNWEAKIYAQGQDGQLKCTPFGNQAQRRRWLRRIFMPLPGTPLLVFAYMYLFKLGILDGRAGLIYSTFRAVQFFHIKAKIYEQIRNNQQGHNPQKLRKSA